jgi:predicted GNAT family acetyltransferase
LRLLSPLFSTTRGAAGVYVSDLWVAAGTGGADGWASVCWRRRGTKALARWGARFLRLGVAQDNAAARAFYERLGFTATTDETMMTLTGAALAALEGAP